MSRIFSAFVWGGLLCLTLASCGGGGGGGSVQPTADQDFGGLWEGEWLVDGGPPGGEVAIAISTDDGRFEILLPEIGIRISGMLVSLDGRNVIGTGHAFTLAEGDTFPGGATVTGFDFSGEVDERATITGNWEIDAGDFGTFSFVYDDLHQRGAALETLAGLWVLVDPNLNPIPIGIFDIDNAGNVFLENPACIFSGTVTIPDADYNVYEWNVTVTDNLPNICQLAGASSGLAALGDQDEDNPAPQNDLFLVLTSRGDATAAALLFIPAI